MAGSLDSETDALFEECIDELGDPITYAPRGANPRTVYAYVDHQDKTEALAGTQLTDQDITVEVLKRDVPTVTATDKITLPRIERSLNPREWTNDASGKSWIIRLKKVR